MLMCDCTSLGYPNNIGGCGGGPPRNFRLISARLDGYNHDFVSLAGGANTFSSHIKQIVPNEMETC